jgi:predicted RNase H-like HicB family nuclease
MIVFSKIVNFVKIEMMSYKVNIVYEKDEHGYYVYAPALPGCYSQGDTFEEASANIREAVELYVSTLTPEETETLGAKEILTTSIEIKVA